MSRWEWLALLLLVAGLALAAWGSLPPDRRLPADPSFPADPMPGPVVILEEGD